MGDIPRCLEHEPGVEEQIPGLCPGVSGYCATGFLHSTCRFDCTTGPDINSVCTADGTWAPYPTCQGDLRELRDGCDGCPGPFGGARNRTAEAILNENTVSDRRVPKTITGNGGRKNVPSFAGNINIGPLGNGGRQQNNNRFNNQNQNNRFNQNNQNNRQQPRRNPLFAEQFPATSSGNSGRGSGSPANTQTRFEEQPRRPQQARPQPQHQPQRRPDSNLSLFDQIKARAQGSNSQAA